MLSVGCEHFWGQKKNTAQPWLCTFCVWINQRSGCQKRQDRLRLWIRESITAVSLLHSGTSEWTQCDFHPSLSLSLSLGSPHLGSNEQYAEEGIFLTQHWDTEQPNSSSTDAKWSCQQLRTLLLPTFAFSTISLSYISCVSVSISPISLSLFPSAPTIHLDSRSTASDYEPHSNNLRGLLEVTVC